MSILFENKNDIIQAMQIIHSKGNIVEKVIRDKDGKLVRAKFFIYENNGRIKARLIDFIFLNIQELAGKVLALAGFSTPTSKFGHPISKAGVASPYFNKESIYFSGSKPRAPTLI